MKYFHIGPGNLFEIMECEELEDAVDVFTDAFKFAFLKNKLSVDFYVTKNFTPEGEYHNQIIDTIPHEWPQIEALLRVDAEENFNTLLTFTPNIYDQEWSERNDYQLFLLLGSAYIKAKFFRKSSSIYSESMFEMEEKRTPGLLYLEATYNIDRFWWFNDKYFEKSRQQMCYMHKSMFPNQIDKFLLDNER